MRSPAMKMTWHGFMHDVSASVVVFLLGLPIAMGVALASGAPIGAGLVAAMVGGVVAGGLTGAPMQVSGPVIGLAMLTHNLIAEYGFSAVSMVTCAAGILQLGMGAARLGQLAAVVPRHIISGMMAGIGGQVVLAQAYIVLGHRPSRSTWADLTGLGGLVAHVNWQSLGVGAIGLAVLWGWPHLKYLRRIPPSLMAVCAASLATWAWGLDVPKVSLGDDVFSFSLPQIHALPPWVLVEGCLSVGLIATLHSLLSAIATDQLHPGPRAQLNRELLSQGAANVASGFLGGLPVSGVILRSSANISAGARTRLSTMLHGVWTFAAVMFASDALRQVPQACLAALFIAVGLRLIRQRDPALRRPTVSAMLFWTTCLGVLFIDVLAGITMGLVLSLVARACGAHPAPAATQH